MLERFGAGNTMRQSARLIRRSAYLLNVYDTFASYERAESGIEWRKAHPDGAEFIDRIKDLIDSGENN